MLQMSLTQIIVDFFNITAKCSPSILISKPKFHFLIHLPAFIWCFGPTILFFTEHYESFNHVFQLSCIYSNCQAPSHNSCNTFVAQDHIKHIAMGGYWLDANTQTWVWAGQAILDHMSTHNTALSWLGLPKESKLTLGEFTLSLCLSTSHWTFSRQNKACPPVSCIRMIYPLLTPSPDLTEQDKNISSLTSWLWHFDHHGKPFLSSGRVLYHPKQQGLGAHAWLHCFLPANKSSLGLRTTASK